MILLLQSMTMGNFASAQTQPNVLTKHGILLIDNICIDEVFPMKIVWNLDESYDNQRIMIIYSATHSSGLTFENHGAYFDLNNLHGHSDVFETDLRGQWTFEVDKVTDEHGKNLQYDGLDSKVYITIPPCDNPLDFIENNPNNITLDTEIPSWIKQAGDFWVQGQTTDREFASSIAYLVRSDIIPVSGMDVDPNGDIVIDENIQLPDWIKNTITWWVSGAISDSEFQSGVKFLLEEKIINFKEAEPINVPTSKFVIPDEILMDLYTASVYQELTTLILLDIKNAEIDIYDNARKNAWNVYNDNKNVDVQNIATLLESTYKQTKDESLYLANFLKDIKNTQTTFEYHAKINDISKVDLDKAAKVPILKIDNKVKPDIVDDIISAYKDAYKANNETTNSIQSALSQSDDALIEDFFTFGFENDGLAAAAGDIMFNQKINLHREENYDTSTSFQNSLLDKMINQVNAIDESAFSGISSTADDPSFIVLDDLINDDTIRSLENKGYLTEEEWENLEPSDPNYIPNPDGNEVSLVPLPGLDDDDVDVNVVVEDYEIIQDDASNDTTIPNDDITNDDFTIEANPLSLTLSNGEYAEILVKTKSLNGWESPIQITTPIVPSPMTYPPGYPHYVYPTPESETSSTIPVQISGYACTGNYILRVYGYGEHPAPDRVYEIHSVDVEINTIREPSLELDSLEKSITIVQGGSHTFQLSFNSLDYADYSYIVGTVDGFSPPSGVGIVTPPTFVSVVEQTTVYAPITITTLESTAPTTFELPIYAETGLDCYDPYRETTSVTVNIVSIIDEETEMVQLIPVTALSIGDQQYPISQFTLWKWEGECDDQWHYHSPTGHVVALDGLTGIPDPDQANCGFGKVSSFPNLSAWMSQNEIDNFKAQTDYDPLNSEAIMGGSGP